MSVSDVGMGQHGLIGKVPVYKLPIAAVGVSLPQLATILSSTGSPPIRKCLDHSNPLILIPTSTNGTILLESHHTS
jgi:hypothetical protein